MFGGSARSDAGSRRRPRSLRKLWVSVASWATIAAGFALEPLLALGPGVVVFLNPPFVSVTVVALGVFAIVRVALGAARWIRRRTSARLVEGRAGPPTTTSANL